MQVQVCPPDIGSAVGCRYRLQPFLAPFCPQEGIHRVTIPDWVGNLRNRPLAWRLEGPPGRTDCRSIPNSARVDPGAKRFDFLRRKLLARRHLQVADMRHRFVEQAVFGFTGYDSRAALSAS